MMRVRSRDGVDIAVWVEGDGQPLVLVHGSIADHTTLDPFTHVARKRFTTYALDRRGFGASGDAEPYSIERDFDDVAAVVDAVAAERGPVVLFGHSYGAGCAMGAAARTRNVSHLVLYEPCLGLSYPPGCLGRVESLLATGDREAAIVEVFVGVLELSGDDVEAFRQNPLWPTRLAVAHTVPRECHVEQDWVYRPDQFAAVSAPTLMLLGSETPAEVAKCTDAAATALGAVTVRTLHGHGHFAHKEDPEMVTGLFVDFVTS